MPSQLEGFAPYGVCYLKIPDFLPDLDEITVFKYCKDDNNAQADDKADQYFLLQRHNYKFRDGKGIFRSAHSLYF